MRYLGIDYGTKRIGVAVSDEEGRVAFPLAVVPAGAAAPAKVAALVKERGAGKIVIGESRAPAGGHNPLQRDIARFAQELGEISGAPVEYEQELFTSAQAARQFAPPAGGRGSRKANPPHKKLDASAAALLLQSFLDTLNR